MNESLDYHAWLSRQHPVTKTRVDTDWLPPDTRRRAGGVYIGDTWVPDGLHWDDWFERTVAAAELMLEDPRMDDVGPMAFAGRALSLVEMQAIGLWQRHSLAGIIERWINELYRELEAKHGYCHRYEDQVASEDQDSVGSAAT